MTGREKLLAKVRALMAKTEAAGCTMQEAMLALEKVQQLRDEHGITERELRDGGDATGVGHMKHGRGDPIGAKNYLGGWIAVFCQVKMWRQSDGFYIAGLPEDVMMADYLMDALAGFVSRELDTYMTGNRATGDRRRRMVQGFVMGACRTIGERLGSLSRETREREERQQAAGLGRDITIHKRALIDGYLASIGFQDGRQPRSRQRVHGDAREAGRAAGTRASFSRPIGSQDGQDGA